MINYKEVAIVAAYLHDMKHLKLMDSSLTQPIPLLEEFYGVQLDKKSIEKELPSIKQRANLIAYDFFVAEIKEKRPNLDENSISELARLFPQEINVREDLIIKKLKMRISIEDLE